MAAAKPFPIAAAAAFAVLLVLVGILVASNAYTLNKLDETTKRIASAEANARTAWGKLYDAEENQQEAIEAAQNGAALEVYAIQGKLDACLKGKP